MDRTGVFKERMDAINDKLSLTSTEYLKNITSDTTTPQSNKEALPLVSEQIELKNEIQKLIRRNKAAKVSIKKKHSLIEAIKKEIEDIDEELENPRCKILRSVFSEPQINLLRGNLKKVYWTDDDLAQAFTVRHMGGKDLYLYLKNTLNYPLPSLGCIQTWAANN